LLREESQGAMAEALFYSLILAGQDA
jgi:hypothetical protein